jgi:hypothetical protein
MVKKFVHFGEVNSKKINLIFVLTGLFISFLLFFVHPIFLNRDSIMKFPEYVPIVEPIGLDLNYILDYCTSWFIKQDTPYVGLNLYPPLAMLFFRPLLNLSRADAFEVITALTLIAYVFTAFVIPVSIIGVVFAIGLFSYGLHFEIEKGQFNLIAFFFASFGVYLFHKKIHFRYLAYLMLTVAIQLKVYPAIFAVMMVDDWVDWKTNLKRFFALVVFNVLLLFVAGKQVFLEFIEAIQKQMVGPNMAITNHSIKVFAELLFRKIGFQEYFLNAGMSQNQLKSLIHYTWVVEASLVGVVAFCMLAILIKSHRLKLPALNPYVFLAASIVALVIPSVSNDYKLPLLAGPVGVFLQYSLPDVKNNLKSAMLGIIKFWVSATYATTLFSYTNKPLFMQNNLPALLLMMVAITVMIALEKTSAKASETKSS